ncbi:TonB-dependent receptor plug domain-containing protein [Sphingobacterium gobiense]|uniref:TonB-dependent receptor plug domain-containing protein n=1 Tax=Sphingobacterium gobiense TaxID=1382456 RepID=A0A2S9JLM9_9SPHI|nr:TonB-dependent receptor plug domain-containing protein [Sphingobacterium gobiense]PRD54065.1 hypothetical protein C5749_11255 [Sphingobacterium gobiense]
MRHTLYLIPFFLSISVVTNGHAQSRDTLKNVVYQKDSIPVAIEEVTVHGRQRKHIEMMKSTVTTIDKEMLETMPAFLGEKDVMRTLQMMPGVSASSEGSAEIQVRGGTADQNLIMLDGVPLYNSTHLFGMYSSFNPLVVKDAKLYTGAFPAWFGGKVSSVVDVTTRDANFNRASGSVELGLTSGKGHLELPVVNNKLSLFLAGRRTFLDALSLLNQSSNKEFFNFYDVNSILTYQPDSLNVIKLSSYFEGDQFRYKSSGRDVENDGLMKTQRAVSLNWGRQMGQKLKSNLTATHNYYSNKLLEERLRPYDSNSYRNYFRSKISAIGLKATLDYDLNKNMNIITGADYNLHNTDPSTLYGENNGTPFRERGLATSRIGELSGFAQLSFTLKKTALTTGARHVTFMNSGYRTTFLEPRVSLYQGIGEHLAVKASYSRMTQPVQRLLNAGLGMPMEIIFPSDGFARPQVSDIFTIGIARDFVIAEDRQLSLSVEAYHKKMKNIVSFIDGYDTRSVIYHAFGGVYRAGSVHNMILTDGIGRAKGVDFKLDGTVGNLSGWLSYSLSRVENKFDGLNGGGWFDALQDRRHLFNAAVVWRINPKWSFSASWMFSSGQPVNIPESYFVLAKPYPSNELVLSGENIYSYGVRNGYRMIPFHKLDIGFTKNMTAFRRSAVLSFGVYNLYNRKNASFYYLGIDKANNNIPQIKSLSVFPAIPSVSLKVNFNRE